MASSLSSMVSVECAKGMAMLEGLKLAVDVGVSHCVVETDTTSLVSLVVNKLTPRSDVGLIVFDEEGRPIAWVGLAGVDSVGDDDIQGISGRHTGGFTWDSKCDCTSGSTYGYTGSSVYGCTSGSTFGYTGSSTYGYTRGSANGCTYGPSYTCTGGSAYGSTGSSAYDCTGDSQ
ncbi:hypothetical protein ACOSQ3_003398 [Xanthoceras sorbifolium]